MIIKKIVIDNKENSNNNTEEKIIRNNSYYERNSQNKTNPTTEKVSANQRFSSNYSKYNVVKRNTGNYNIHISDYETNSTKKFSYGKSEDKISQ